MNDQQFRRLPGYRVFSNKNGVLVIKIKGGWRLLLRVRPTGPTVYNVKTADGRKVRMSAETARALFAEHYLHK